MKKYLRLLISIFLFLQFGACITTNPEVETSIVENNDPTSQKFDDNGDIIPIIDISSDDPEPNPNPSKTEIPGVPKGSNTDSIDTPNDDSYPKPKVLPPLKTEVTDDPKDFKITRPKKKIDSFDFYENWSGHKINHLETIIEATKEFNRIWLIGDSSLDNKYWAPLGRNKSNFLKVASIPNAYKDILLPSSTNGKFEIKKDVNYHLNNILSKKKKNWISINTAVEATTVRSRIGKKKLYAQDTMVQSNISEKDILIVSVGGNDIALSPKFKTTEAIDNLFSKQYFSEKTYAPLIEIFKDHVESYIKKVVSITKPKKILVCMIYSLSRDLNQGSWASGFLDKIKKLPDRKIFKDHFLKKLFEDATKKIKIEGTEVTPVPLYEYLDESPENYVKVVEPSIIGGRKMAEAFYNIIFEQDKKNK